MRWLCVACVTRKVAPFAGAWIEINELTAEKRKEYSSLPSRERGLK